jgi:hypothetical protein
MGAGHTGPDASPAMYAQDPPPPATLPPMGVSPFDRPALPATNRPAAPPNAKMSAISDAALLAASVRLKIKDPDGYSCGSGTIVDARDGFALILTCGHIFRDSGGKGTIAVDLFGPNGVEQVAGELYSYNLDRDLGLVTIRVPGPVGVVHVAPPGYRIQPGMSVASVGCNNGNAPTVRQSRINSLNKFVGEPNIQVAGQPVEGRSGGGLFSGDGYLIGVCNAADPSDKEGLFAALGSIQAELSRKNAAGRDLAFIYNNASESNGPGSAESAPPAEMLAGATNAASPLPATPREMPGPTDLATLGAAPASIGEPTAHLAPYEQAALDEIRQRMKDGAEVVCIIRPRGDSNAKSEVIMLDRASPELIRQISDVGRRTDQPYPTSFEVLDKPTPPKPCKVLLEWTAPTAGNTAAR